MKLEAEPRNRVDPWAVTVGLPDGRTVGRVPACFTRLISRGMQLGQITYGRCIYLGSMRHDGIVRGGGPKLEVAYQLYVVNQQLLKDIALCCHTNVDNDMFYL